MINCVCVSKAYGATKVINDFTAKFHDGTTYLNGANGSGKSTLMRLIAGIENVSSGKINFTNKDTKYSCSLSTDSITPPDIFTTNELFFLQKKYNKVDDELLNLLIKKINLTQFLGTRIRDLSTGTKKKVSVIMSLVKESQILLLDEPFNGLDQLSKENIAEAINNDSRSKIIVDHFQILSPDNIILL